jgi:hypothetical protein
VNVAMIIVSVFYSISYYLISFIYFISKFEKVKRKGKEQCKKKSVLCFQENVRRGLLIMEQEDESLSRSRKLFGKVSPSPSLPF